MFKQEAGTVVDTGVEAGRILTGVKAANRGLRIKIATPQPTGRTGWVKGSFELLAAGGDYEQYLVPLIGQHFTAEELIGEVAAKVGKRTLHILNCNMLKLAEEGTAGKTGETDVSG